MNPDPDRLMAAPPGLWVCVKCEMPVAGESCGYCGRLAPGVEDAPVAVESDDDPADTDLWQDDGGEGGA